MAFQLTIVTPEGEAWEGTAERAVLPGTEGDFGVLPGHEPFLTALRIGPAEIDTGSETLLAAISGGFAEVHADSVTVMVSSCSARIRRTETPAREAGSSWTRTLPV